MAASLAHGPNGAEPARFGGVWRVAGAYATDLSVSLLLVITIASLLSPPGLDGTSLDWLNDLRAAVGRFTPFGLWEVYRGEATMAIASVVYQAGSGALPNLVLGLQALLQITLAAPATLIVIYQQSNSIGDWITLAGFAGLLVVAFLTLLTGCRLSLMRVLLATVASPLAATGLFWMLQHTLLDMLDGLGWLASIAPWCLICPIACTLYWVMLPNAEHGATVTCMQAAGRLRLGLRQRRARRMARSPR